MQVLTERRDRERYLAVNQPLSLRVSKPMAANLAVKAIQLESSSSELARLLISAGADALGWGDIDSVC
jgi:hypothetical protein